MNTETKAPSKKQQEFPIAPETFWKEFTKALRQKWSSEVKTKYYKNQQWTSFMTGVLEDVGATLDCHVDREYWPRVDVSYFNERTAEEWMEWSREAAIEIEAGADWTQELCKLIEINAGLKVLIAYHKRADEPTKVLELLPRIYNSRKYVTKNCKFLFIFGNGNDFAGFTAYTFDGDVVKEMGSFNPESPS